MNKKGQGQFGIFKIMIISFLMVIFFAGLIWVMGILNDTFTEIGVKNEVHAGSPGYVNISYASEQIWGEAYDSIKGLRLVAITYILALCFGTILIGFLERKHPLLFFVYLFITLLAVLFAPNISNAYENILNSNIFDGELQNFGGSNWIILNLPFVVLVVGTLGSIGLFINLIRGDNQDLRI